MGTMQGDSQDQRAKQRNKVLKSAKIVLDDWAMLDCTVRDLSETGAKLIVSNAALIPGQFRLLMTADHTIRPVGVVRRTAGQLGIQFLGPAARAPLRKL